MSKVSYVCPLCGHEFALKSRQKTVKCGDHTLRVAESEGILTIQVMSPVRATKTKTKENVLKVSK